LITDPQIKTALYDLIEPIVRPGLVYKRWELGFNTANNVQMLTCPDEISLVTGKALLHAWMMTRKAAPSGAPQMGRSEPAWTYRLWGFLSYETGPDDSNSEDRFNAEVDAVTAAVNRLPTLGLLDNSFLGHDGLQVLDLDTYPLGEEIVHLAKCELTLLLSDQF